MGAFSYTPFRVLYGGVAEETGNYIGKTLKVDLATVIA